MKAIKFCETSPLLLTTVHRVKSKRKISQNFLAFSEYMNFNVADVQNVHPFSPKHPLKSNTGIPRFPRFRN